MTVQILAAWLITYAVHSTILLGSAALVARRLGHHPRWAELLWKTAMLGAVLSATAQLSLGFRPLAGTYEPPVELAVTPHDHGSEAGSEPRPGTPASGLGANAGAPTAARGGSPAGTLPTRALTVLERNGTGWLLGWVWVIGAILNLGIVLRARRRLGRLLRDRRPVEDPALDRFLLDLSRGGYRLRRSPGCPVPMAYGRNEIVVPDRFHRDLSPEERLAAIAHEAAHLVRRDPGWLLAGRVLTAALFFQPLNRLGGRRVREAAEYLCDEWAAERTGRLALASCLLEVGGWLHARPASLPAAACPMAASKSAIARRIERLTDPPVSSRRPALSWFAVAIVLFAGVAPGVRLEPAPGSPPMASSNVTVSDVTADSLADRWRLVVRQAGVGGEASFWVGYAFATPIHAGDLLYTDSRGETFVVGRGEMRVEEPTLATRLSAPADDAVAVLALYTGGATPTIQRLLYRSTALAFDFGASPVHWIGTASSDQSLTLVVDLIDAQPSDEIGIVAVELASLHPQTEQVLAALERWSRLGSSAIRREAAEGFNHHHDPRGVRLLERLALSDPAPDVRAEAAETIGEVQDPSATGAILRLALEGTEPAIRREAAEGLAYQPSARALPALRRLLAESDDLQVQEAAVEASGEMPPADAIGILEQVAEENVSPRIRRAAVHVVGYLAVREPGPTVLDRIERTLRSAIFAETEREVVLEAVERATDLPASRRRRLLALVSESHPDPDVRSLAADLAREGI